MNAKFYRRIRMFCEIPIAAASWATGIAPGRLTAIETGRREANHAETRLIESFLRDKLHNVINTEGPVPDWIHHDATKLLDLRRHWSLPNAISKEADCG